VAAALVLVASACGSSDPSTAVGTTPASGGTVTWATQPGQYPNWIFPMTSADYFSVTNLTYFQELMYRTLYWFGSGTQPTLNNAESLAYQPAYHGNQVTIKLKPGIKWSDGTPVDASDVMFWMNMLVATDAQAEPSWGGFVPHEFPNNVTDIHAVGTDEVTMTIKGKYTPLWFTDNELSQITPMPKAWDRTASGPSDCASVIADCLAVLSYLNKQAADTSTYATSPLWSVVDGPWKLKSFVLAGDAVFTLNKDYWGKLPPHHIDTFEEVPFTTEQAEYNQLQAGGAGRLDVGYLPTVDAPVPPAGGTLSQSQNPLPGYRIAPQTAWGINYMPYDFMNPQAGPLFAQLYIRQSIQYLVDQEGIIDGPLHGYGKALVGPVADDPVTAYLSPQAVSGGDKYVLNPAAATKLLESHGWHVVPNGQTTCESPGTGPGECGAHITKGEALTFNIYYVSGVSWVQSAVREMISNALEVGIHISVREGSFEAVTGNLGVCDGATHPMAKCTWQILDWGQGWVYSPDYLPTGEELFETGSGDNFGDYSNARNDELIQASLHASKQDFAKDFYAWENYLAGQLPVVMEPESPYQLNETVDNLHAPTEPPTLTLTPEDWYYLK
jgi:peptide/nickel transport system substrate-binding protein